MLDTQLAEAILMFHFLIIAFNVAGLIVIPLGAWRGWKIVRIAWLRLAHLGIMAIVAGQAVLGRPCFLTIWQNQLSGAQQPATPMIMQWVNHLIYWNLPIWVFAIFYCLLLFYILALTVLVPFGRRVRPRRP
jgi:hypothetical protein